MRISRRRIAIVLATALLVSGCKVEDLWGGLFVETAGAYRDKVWRKAKEYKQEDAYQLGKDFGRSVDMSLLEADALRHRTKLDYAFAKEFTRGYREGAGESHAGYKMGGGDAGGD